MPDEAITQPKIGQPANGAFDPLLLAKARKVGVATEGLSEDELAIAVARKIEKIEFEIRAEMEAYNAYVKEHGSPAELLRQHYAEEDGPDRAV